MINETLAYWAPGPLELIVILFVSGFWLLLIILPILYVVHSVKKRREILTKLEKLSEEVGLLRQEVKGSKTGSGQV